MEENINQAGMEENINNQEPIYPEPHMLPDGTIIGYHAGFIGHQAGTYNTERAAGNSGISDGSCSTSIGYSTGQYIGNNHNHPGHSQNHYGLLSNNNTFIGYNSYNPKIRKIEIDAMSGNGFMVKVGCTEFAFNDKKEMIEYLNDYILNPAETEKKYHEGILFKKDNAEVNVVSDGNTNVQDKTDDEPLEPHQKKLLDELQERWEKAFNTWERVFNKTNVRDKPEQPDTDVQDIPQPEEHECRCKTYSDDMWEQHQQSLREDLTEKWKKSGLLDGLTENTDPIEFDKTNVRDEPFISSRGIKTTPHENTDTSTENSPYIAERFPDLRFPVPESKILFSVSGLTGTKEFNRQLPDLFPDGKILEGNVQNDGDLNVQKLNDIGEDLQKEIDDAFDEENNSSEIIKNLAKRKTDISDNKSYSISPKLLLKKQDPSGETESVND